MSDDNDNEPKPSLCDGDRTNNIWVEGGNPSIGNGICLLDTMTESQVVYSLQHNPKAAADLKRVTTNEALLHLADTVPLLPTTVEEDETQKEMNRHDEPGSIPFYAIFRGRAQRLVSELEATSTHIVALLSLQNTRRRERAPVLLEDEF